MKPKSPAEPGGPSQILRWWWVAAILIFAGSLALLYVPPHEAAGLNPVPDAMELAIGGRRLAAGEGFNIVVGGVARPPRYPPWFSLVFEAPVFLIGSRIGLAILPVTAMALLGVMLAFHLGRRAAGIWGGCLCALALVLLPLYRRSAGQVMTDVPCTTLVLACMALYVRLRGDARNERALFFAGALLGSLSFLIRHVTGAALLPLGLLALARPGLARRVACTSCVVLPLLGAMLAQLAYNRSAFGDPFRTGFQYWCAVPYDYPDMVMSSSHLGANLGVLVESKLAWLVAGIGVLGTFTAIRLRSRPGYANALGNVRAMAEFTVACGLPILVFHLHYYMARPRYYLPILAMLIVLAGALIGIWIERAPRRLWAAALLLFVAIALVRRSQRANWIPYRYLAARRILERTPEDAIVISAMAPAYLEEVANPRGTRTLVPLSRGVEYAGKVIVHKRIDRPGPLPEASWGDAHLQLLAGGGEWGVAEVAGDRIDEFRSALAAGRRVFLDSTDSAWTGSLPALAEMRRSFSCRLIEGELQELVLR